MKKAQIAVEYLVITSFLLIATGLIFVVSTSSLNQNLSFAKTDKVLLDLATAAEKVSARGPNNKLFVQITLPNEIESNPIVISKNTLTISLTTPNGINQRHTTTKADLNTSFLSTGEGIHTIKVEMVDGNVVFTEV